MNKEAQRIAIASACGWTQIEMLPSMKDPFTDEENYLGTRLEPVGRSKTDQFLHIPDYLNDLNAMHEAEKGLKEGREQDEYAAALGDLTGGRQIDLGALRINATTKIIFATAAQRAEAFLKALKLWNEVIEE